MRSMRNVAESRRSAQNDPRRAAEKVKFDVIKCD